MSLEVENLEFSFGRKDILNDICFGAKKGELLGILGPNGCGKSTLLKNILQIYRPKSGIIKLEDKDISDYSLKDLAKLIGFVPQKSALAMPLLVEEIILMGRFSHMKNGFSGYSKEDIKEVDTIMKLLELENFRGRVAFSLSGGEFQRVLLARALVSRPDTLLLDEPTSALDINFSIHILQICKRLIRKLGILGVIVIHDLNLAALFCDRVVMLKDGKIAYCGTTKELFTKEILKEIYDFDCDVIEYNGAPVIIPLNTEIRKKES